MTTKLTPQQELASRVLARRRLIHFIKRRDTTYKDGWVHNDVCRRLEKFSDDVANGLSPRLMLLMPPRLGKSRIASQEFPAWHLGRYPEHEFIAASYNVSLPMGFSRKIQAIIEDPRYPFEGVKLDQNNKSAETWGLTKDGLITPGAFVAAGVGGGITGKGAHIGLIDDPIKNAEEADSMVTREALWEWYTSTFYTRLAPGGGVLIIQTCWHDDDLAGRLQQIMKEADPSDPDVDRFEIVKYPAIAEADEWMDLEADAIIRVETDKKPPTLQEEFEAEHEKLKAEATTRAAKTLDLTKHRLIRVKGEALHPARYDLRKLNRIKRTLPIRFWSALYQQNPVPDDGTFFTREQFKRAILPPRNACHVFISFDFAITEKQHNDYTVGVVALQDEDDVLHFADMVRFKSKDAFFIVEAIISLIKKWNGPNLRLGFENGQIFLALESLLKKRMREESLHVPYETLQPVTDKKVRASPLQGRMQQGRASFMADAEFFNTMQSEMLRFPSGVNDDIVDAMAWNARMVQQYEPPHRPKSRTRKSWKDKLPRGATKSGSHMRA